MTCGDVKCLNTRALARKPVALRELGNWRNPESMGENVATIQYLSYLLRAAIDGRMFGSEERFLL